MYPKLAMYNFNIDFIIKLCKIHITIFVTSKKRSL